MAGYGTMLLGGVGALRLVDLPELARSTGRSMTKTALSEGTAWYWAFYLVLIIFAYLTNPTDAHFRTFLTDLSFHQHLRRLRSPSDSDNGLNGTKNAGSKRQQEAHVLTFSNRITISLRTPPYIRRDFIFFSTVCMSDIISSTPPSSVSKRAEGLEEGIAPPDKSHLAASGFGARRAFFLGAFGRWWTWDNGMSFEPRPLRCGSKPSAVGSDDLLETLDTTVDIKDSESPTPTPSESDYVPTEGKLPTHHSTSGRSANSKVLPRVIRTGQRRGGGQPVAPTTISDLRARAKIARAQTQQANSPSPSPSAIPQSASDTQDSYLSTHTDKNLPGLPFHVTSANSLPDRQTVNASTTSPTSPDLPSTLVLVSAQGPSSNPAIRELQHQIDETQTSMAATESRLQAELEDLKSRKRDEEALRQDLRARTRTLEDNKRTADVERHAADKKLMNAKAEKNLLASRLEKAKRELSRLEKREGDAAGSVEKGLAEAKEEEEVLRKEAEEKRVEVREMETALSEDKARRSELQQRLEARKAELFQRRESLASRRAKARIEAEQRQRLGFVGPQARSAALQTRQAAPVRQSSSPSSVPVVSSAGSGTMALYSTEPQVWGPPLGSTNAPDPWENSASYDNWAADLPPVLHSYHRASPVDAQDEASSEFMPRSTTPTYEPPDAPVFARIPLAPGFSEHRKTMQTAFRGAELPSSESTASEGTPSPFAPFGMPRSDGKPASPLSALAISDKRPSPPHLSGLARAGASYGQARAPSSSGFGPNLETTPSHSYAAPGIHVVSHPGDADDAQRVFDGSMQSPITPHQTSLIPSQLFSMLDQDGGGDGYVPLSSPSPMERSRVTSFLDGSPTKDKLVWLSGDPVSRPLSTDTAAAAVNPTLLGLNPSAKAFNFAQPSGPAKPPSPFDAGVVPTSTGLGKVFSAAPGAPAAMTTQNSMPPFDPFNSPWANVFGPIGTSAGSSSMQAAAPGAGGSRMKALFNRSRGDSEPGSSSAGGM